MDGSGSDDTTNRGGETKLKLWATEGDREVALPRKGHLKFTFWIESVWLHAIGEKATR